MTCVEFHDYLDRDLRIDNPAVSVPAEIAEHIARCPRCYRFAAGQEELRTSLHLVQDAAPVVPASVDRIVLANYRQHVRHKAYSANRKTKRASVLAAVGWAGAAAAIVLAASYGAMVLFPGVRHFDGQTAKPTPLQSEAKPKRDSAATSQLPRTAATAPTPQRTGNLVKQWKYASEIAEEDTFPLAEFQGLMYCDELSCAGAMDVIRVRVPAGTLGLPSTSLPANALVSADILVGPDGIARGIRVPE